MKLATTRTSIAQSVRLKRFARKTMARLDRRVEFALLRHTNTRGGLMSFDRRPYLLPIYLDRSRERVFKKSVQCGISELLIVDALESAHRGLACLYVMPTQEKRQKFVANRVSRVITASRFYSREIRSGSGKANTIGLKHFGRGVISFVGSNAENEFVEFPADLAIVDEYDRCTQRNMPLVRDRLAASPHKLAVFASTPTVAGFGISNLFDASDAKEWHVRCAACGERQPLDFFANVVRQIGDGEYELLDRNWPNRATCSGKPVQPTGGSPGFPANVMREHERKTVTGTSEVYPPGRRASETSGDVPVTAFRPSSEIHAPARDIRVFCRQCGRPIDRLAEGEWVARHPGRGVSGYHISQLFVPTASIADLWRDWQGAIRNDWERQRFHNSLLDEPYVAEGNGLSLADLLACCRDYEMPRRAARCTMGVDVGEWLHVRISDHPEPGVRRAVFVGRVRSPDELDALMERFDVRCCVVDAQPEARLVREWQKAHSPGRIWRCLYTDDDVREPRKDVPQGIVRIARTPALDDATEDILSGRNWLPRNAQTLDDGNYAKQMLAPVRQLTEGAGGNPRYIWTKTAADHHRHADNYDKIASRLAPAPPAISIAVTGSRTFAPSGGRIFRAA